MTLRFANDILLHQEVPDQWSLSDIIPISKKGDLGKNQNYHGSSLSEITVSVRSTTSKVLGL